MSGLPADPAAAARRILLPPCVVVVGATGFVGRNLVERLRGEVERIVPVSTSGADVAGIPGLRLGDLANIDTGTDAALVDVAGHRYDASRFAASQPEILLRNVERAGRVYEVCAAKGIAEVRIASSIAVYPAADTAADDAAPVDLNRAPHDGELMYAWSKRIGELYGRLFARQCGVNTIAFRLTNPFGPHDSLDPAKAHVVPAFVMRALAGSGPFAVRGDPRASRDFVYVGDVCEVIVRSLRLRGRSDAYNLGSGENTTIEQLARSVLRLVGREAEIVAAGAATSAVAHRRCRVERVRADFAIDRFTALEQGLVPTIAWYRDVCRR